MADNCKVPLVRRRVIAGWAFGSVMIAGVGVFAYSQAVAPGQTISWAWWIDLAITGACFLMSVFFLTRPDGRTDSPCPAPRQPGPRWADRTSRGGEE